MKFEINIYSPKGKQKKVTVEAANVNIAFAEVKKSLHKQYPGYTMHLRSNGTWV